MMDDLPWILILIAGAGLLAFGFLVEGDATTDPVQTTSQDGGSNGTPFGGGNGSFEEPSMPAPEGGADAGGSGQTDLERRVGGGFEETPESRERLRELNLI